jgi:arylsulfatase A-like enzyme
MRRGDDRPVRCVLIALFAVLTTTGCEPRGPWEEPRFRFVDRHGDGQESSQPPTATINDETRHVLAAPPQAVLLPAQPMPIPASARISLRRPLAPVLRGSKGLILAARVRGAGNTWLSLPPVAVRVPGETGQETVAIDLDLPRQFAASSAQVRVVAYGAAPGAITARRTPVVEVPKGAALELGMGLLEAGHGQKPVDFIVRTCRGERCESLLEERLDPAQATQRGWVDRRLSLRALAGQSVSFHFETRSPGDSGDSFALPVWSNPTIYAKVRKAKALRVILLSIDTLRADHLTSYGYRHDTAPFIDARFARGGTVFEDLIASATTTGPAHMTMFTSLQPSVHGITDKPAVSQPPPTTLAEILRRHGFVTGAVTEDGPLHAAWGFSRGFDSYAENKSPDVMLPQGHIKSTFATGVDWLRRNKHRRFFLFLHTFQVHYPYTPPNRYEDLFGSEERVAGLPRMYDPALYDREIRYVDDQLRLLFATLESEGLLEDVVFILTSDHGEEFLEHGFIGHGAHLHPELLHVPLMVVGPGVPAGRRIAQPVGHVDLLPTILELAAVPPPPVVMGRSFADVLQRGGEEREALRPLYSEAWYGNAMTAQGKVESIEQPTFSVRLGERKLVKRWVSGKATYQYFDLSADPQQRFDLYPASQGEAEPLRRLLDDYPRSSRRMRAELSQQRETIRVPSHGGQIDIDPAVEEKLRALGYLD